MAARRWRKRTALTTVLVLSGLLAASVPAGAEPDGDDPAPATRPGVTESPDAAALSVAAAASAELAAQHDVTLERAVLAELDSQGSTDFWVGFEDRADLSGAGQIDDWAQRGQYVHDRLVGTAQASQAELAAQLRLRGVDVESFWITNGALVRGADRTALDGVLTRPEVAVVRADEAIELPEPVEGSDEAGIQAVEWGIANIRADQVWSELGVRGEGITVGSIDTGVAYTHPGLVNQYRGNAGDGTFGHDYHWWDPSGVCPDAEPCDNNNHGTHTTGTMVGDGGAGNQVGVAPRAQWIAAKGCERSSCSQAALLSSGEFMLAPTDLEGDDPRPEWRPHIVNNSWGGSGGREWYDDMVAAWTAAGMFPVFSNGNTGSSCGSAGSPADAPDAYGVGAHASSNHVASFSSRGPGRAGEIKPNISAPGVNVRSSVPGGGYASFEGTSMAAPHLSGTVALMWSASGQVGDITGTREALDATAVDTEDLTCGGTPDNNNVYGQGRLDAYEAVDWAALDSGLEGRVVDADTGAPAAGVRVEVAETGRSVTTGTAGSYRLMLEPGSYTLEFSQSGQVAATVSDVFVEGGEITTVDAVLGGITGQVVDADGEEPLSDVVVEVTDLGLTTRTDADGGYRFRLEPGTYALELSQFGFVTQRVPAIAVGEEAFTTVDVKLAAAPLGSIAGAVTDEDSGHGLPGITVDILDVPVDLSAASDTNGNYEINGVPAGTYQVRATSSRPGRWWPAPAVEVTVTGDTTSEVAIGLPRAGGIDRISISSDGEEGDAGSGSGSANGAISDDGRYVAFYGEATNLADRQGAGRYRVYVHDRHTGTTELVPASPWRPSISGDGRYVAVPGPADLVDDVPPPELPPLPRFHSFDSRTHVRDRVTGETELVSVNSNGEAVDSNHNIRPVITPDGRYIAFVSHDPQVVTGELPVRDAFFDLWRRPYLQIVVHDRVTGETELVSVNDDGEPANADAVDGLAITPDGRYVAFGSSATNLVAEETNPGQDIFVRDRKTGETQRVSVLESSGVLFDTPSSPRISDDGQLVTYGRGLAPAALYDRTTGGTEPLAGPGEAPVAITTAPVISGDSRYVAFASVALDENFDPIPEQTGTFALDRDSREVQQLVEFDEDTPDGVSAVPAAISDDGRFVLVSGDRLVPGDTNDVKDVFVIDREFDRSTPQARFAVWDLSVEPEAPQPGQPVGITARVKNVGDTVGDYEAVLLVDGVAESLARETVTLAPGEATVVTLTVTRAEGGSYVVRIGQAAGEFRVQSGTLTGQVSDVNNGELVEATVTATSGETTRTTTTLSGAYQLDDLQLGTWTVTVEAEDYVTETVEVAVTGDGERPSRDVALRTGAVAVDSEAIKATIPAGAQSTVDLSLANTGSADLSWSGFAWQATAREDPSILTYSSLHPSVGDTHIDQALQQLGLDYTGFREDVGCPTFSPPEGLEEFGQALADGDWDLVIVDHICTTTGIPPSTVDELTDYVRNGGRLIFHSWQLQHEDSADLLRPLAEALGIQFTGCFSPGCENVNSRVFQLAGAGAFPAHWWQSDHPPLAGPLSVPEFAKQGSLLVEPLDDAEALAGYTLAERPEHAAMVLGNDGRTLFRGFFDTVNDADRDRNGTLDGVQLWINSIVHIGELEIDQWLDVEDSGTLARDGSTQVAVSVDATHLEPGSYTGAVELASDAAREPQVSVPVELTVVGCDRTVTGTHLGRLTVSEGVTCLAEDSRVIGPVKVRRGAGLVANDAMVIGPVSAAGATVVELRDTQVTGPVTVTEATGRVAVAGSRVFGPVRLVGNATGQTPIVISGNRVVGPLVCTGNQPPPVNRGEPNQVTGPTKGQCADL